MKIGDKVVYETECSGKIIHRRGTIIKEYSNYFVIEVTVPAHFNSIEKTRTFRETIHKRSDMRAFVCIDGPVNTKNHAKLVI